MPRKKGVPNRTTQQVKQMINDIINQHLETIEDDLEKLEPKERVKCIIDLMRFVLPTIRSVEVTEPTKPIVISFKD
jgi:DNA phosphorothioation-dependent restriction protein DptG